MQREQRGTEPRGDFLLTVLGSRGSIPVTRQEMREFGGDTSCYLLEARGERLVLDAGTKQVVSVSLRVYASATGTSHYGEMIAGFVVATVPLLIMFMFSSRLYIEGITSGAVKA